MIDILERENGSADAALAFLVPVGDDSDALGHHEGSRAAVAELHRVRERRAAVEISELRAVADLCLQLELVLEDWDRYWAELFDDPRQRLVKPIGLVLASEEISTAWGIPTDAAGDWLREVMFLQRHLPCTWQLAMTGAIRSFTVRAVADAVLRSRIAPELMVIVDREAAGMLPGLPHTRALRVLEGLIVAADPDLAAEREANRARDLGVRLLRADPADPTQRGLLATLRAPDAMLLLATARRLAEQMPTRLNRRDLTHDNRVALALGVLATPARALAMLQAEQQGTQPLLTSDCAPASPNTSSTSTAQPNTTPAWLPTDDPGDSSAQTGWWLVDPPDEVAAGGSYDPRSPAGCTGHTCGTITVPPRTLSPKVDVVVHISAESARSGKGVARVEPLGPVSIEGLAALFHDWQIVVRPVIDLNQIPAVDRYEISDLMRFAVEQRDPYSAFPFSNRRSRGLDLDHIRPYRHEPWLRPTGQTRVGNLAPLTRTDHRAKTGRHGWKVRRSPDGFSEWVSPFGHRYVTGPTGTLRQALLPQSEALRR